MTFASDLSASSRRNIFVVEDQVAVRAGIVEFLNREPDFVVCGEADDVPPALSQIPNTRPDLILTDLQLRTSCGLQLIRELRRLYPTLPIVAMTMFDPIGHEHQAIAAGANGFAMKQEGPENLVRIIRDALGN